MPSSRLAEPQSFTENLQNRSEFSDSASARGDFGLEHGAQGDPERVGDFAFIPAGSHPQGLIPPCSLSCPNTCAGKQYPAIPRA
jgi:hypothetical protein